MHELPKVENTKGSIEAKLAAEYVKEARALLRSGQRNEAYGILLQAMAFYPEHPLILSYCGWLQAVIDKKHRNGIVLCRKAFVVFKTTNPHTAGIVYPTLYLNLGRAFIAAGKKKEAFENFRKGMAHDRSNSEIKKEIQILGVRKKPIIPFLSRSNPINKYIGRLRNKL